MRKKGRVRERKKKTVCVHLLSLYFSPVNVLQFDLLYSAAVWISTGAVGLVRFVAGCTETGIYGVLEEVAGADGMQRRNQTRD